MTTFDLAGVPGVPETTLPAHLLPTLPANVAPAPWSVSGSALVWRSKATPAAREALPAALRDRARPLSVVGGMVRYDETPVGTYDEVFGVVISRLGRRVIGTVVFMAVDSPTSLVGGRTNWSMPKTLAKFEGQLTSGESMSALGDTGAVWRVSANPHVVGPPLPVFSRARIVQEFPDGSLRACRLASRGRMRLAKVQVAVEADGLPAWLTPGSHGGAVISGMRFSLGDPRPL